MNQSKLEIAIVGAGPTGLSLAILLRQAGLNPVIFEKRTQLDGLPAAHVVNVRTCEIFEEMGVFNAIAAVAAPQDKMQAITWRESVSGPVYGKLVLHGDSDAQRQRAAASPVRALNVGQDQVERILRDRLVTLGGEVEFGQEVVDAWVSEGKAILKLTNGERKFDYVIGCDGVRSTVRQSLGIEMEGPASLAEFIAIYFRADLSKYLDASPGPVQFLAGPDVHGSIIGFDLASIWALMCVVPSSTEAYAKRELLGPELVKRAINDPGIDFEILSVGTWNMSAQIAERFREGPVFLAGDAAHRFPPTGGLGLNTGVPDAHNIAWKLIGIENGWAKTSLLDTYETERRPIAIHNCAHSVSNMQRMALIDKELGVPVLEPIDLTLINRPPSPSRDLGLNGKGSDALAKQSRINAAVEGERQHFDSLRVEMGYCYPSSTGADLHPAQPTVGSRVPHAQFMENRLNSTLQLCHSSFGLIAGPGAHAWVDGFAAEAKRRGVPLRTVVMPTQGEDANNWRRALGLESDGVVLVRPDGHIAWIARSNPSGGSYPSRDAILDKLAAGEAI